MKKIHIGQALKRLRRKKGLTQDELGVGAGFSTNTISRFELGTVTPSVDALYKLAIELECTVRDFFVDFDDDADKRAYLFNAICNADSEELNRLVVLVSTPTKKA